MKKAILFFIIIGIYLFVRFSDIDKPLDYNGWSTAHSLITQQIWYENGIQNYIFSPVYTFSSQKDKNINNIGGIKDNQGNYYYISYPPLSFLLPFFVFKLFGIYPALIPLNIFNTFLHVTSAILIYLLISLILKKEEQTGVNRGAFLGFILYLFSPGNFWFYSNIYFVDILENTFFIAGIYFILKIIRQKKFPSKGHLFLFAVLIFSLVYTEWLGLFFALTVLLFSIIKAKQDRRYLMLFSVTAISTLVSILLTFFQYSSIAGFSELLIELQNKYLTRGGIISFFKLKSYLNIIYFYKTYYLIEILISVFLLLFHYFSHDKFRQWLKDKFIFIYFALVPVVLHYLFFFNFNTNHSFSTLKNSTFLVVTMSILIYKLIQLFPKIKIYYNNLLILYIISSSVFYTQHTFSNYGKYDYQLLGNEIRKNSTQEDNIFLCNYPDGFIEPQVLYYSHRNIRYCQDKKEAEDIIDKLSIGKSVIFTLDQNRQIIGIERIDD